MVKTDKPVAELLRKMKPDITESLYGIAKELGIDPSNIGLNKTNTNDRGRFF